MIDDKIQIYKRILIHHYTYRVTISKRGKGGFGLFSPLSIYYILFFIGVTMLEQIILESSTGVTCPNCGTYCSDKTLIAMTEPKFNVSTRYPNYTWTETHQCNMCDTFYTLENYA